MDLILERRPAESLPDYRIDWREGDTNWSARPEPAAGQEPVARPILSGGDDILFEILAPHEQLDRLWVNLGTYARTNTVSLWCELIDDDGEVIGTQVSQPSEISDNVHHPVLSFGTLRLKAGSRYWVRLHSPESNIHDCFAVWTRAASGDYSLARHSEPSPVASRSLELPLPDNGGRNPPDLLPDYRLEWHDSSADWSVAPQLPGAPELVPHPILAGDEATSFEIIAPSGRLDRLWVNLATYARDNSVSVTCELIDAAGETLARQVSRPETITNNAFHDVLDLRGVNFDVGRKYHVRLLSEGATAGDCFALYGRSVQAGRYIVPPALVRFRGERLFLYPDESSAREAPSQVKAYLLLPPGSARVGEYLKSLRRAFPKQPFTAIEFNVNDSLERLWPRIQHSDLVIFADIYPTDASSQSWYDALCFELYRRGACTVALAGSLPEIDEFSGIHLTDGLRARVAGTSTDRSRCQLQFRPEAERLIHVDRPDHNLWRRVGCGHAGAARKLVALARGPRTPTVAIVSVLYKKADIIGEFIDHVLNQSYPGQIDLVLVNDRSPEEDADRARDRAAKLVRDEVSNRSITVLENAENSGNCQSRLRGLSAADADIYIVIDCDCLISPDFVRAHVFEHARQDVDAVIGPLNIESWDRDAPALVRELAASPARISAEASPQDPIQQDGFVNCITRNFSAKRRVVRREPLFDLDFGYSAKPGSGFGWEDVEMGYRLYLHRDVIRFTDLAFSVHVSHSSSVDEAGKIAGSFRNFDRLFAKHPEMELVARRWAVDTYGKLLAWADSAGVDPGETKRSLQQRFEGPANWQRGLTQSYRPGAPRLRILTYRWHVPHQYELYKLPHDFTLATNIGENGWINFWGYDQRPLRSNVRLVPADQIDPRDYDVAIIHFDENILAPNLCNNVIPACWGESADWIRSLSGIPKIAICHGTPQFEGQYALNEQPLSVFSIHEDERQRLVRYFGDAGVRVVCNSWQALEEWGFENARVIWHGFDPQEFPQGTHSRHILALAEDRNRPHYRGAWQHGVVASRLDPGISIETSSHRGAPIERRNTNAFAVRSFRSYVDRIGSFTAYLNTTLRSPMPRSRGEAMMTGVIPVSLANHDVHRFIEPGENGFFSNEPEEVADWLNFVFRNESEARRISARARQTAIDLFNHDRYLSAWTDLIADAVGHKS